jgi:hypothetical protein
MFDLVGARRAFFQPPYANASCRPIGWLSSSQGVIGCHADGGTGTDSVWSTAFRPSWEPVSTMPVPQPLQVDGVDTVSEVLATADGRAVVLGRDSDGRARVVLVDGSTVSTVWVADSVESADIHVSGNEILLTVDADDTPALLLGYDTTTRTTTELMPRLASSGEDAVGWVSGVRSTAVASDS